MLSHCAARRRMMSNCAPPSPGRAAGVVVWTSRPDRGVHAKTLAVDEQLLVEGSFNWFSAVAEGGPYHRYEASLAYRGEHVGVMIEEALASLRQRVEVQAR